MSNGADLAAVGDSTTIPGYVISRPRLLEDIEAEEIATQQYMKSVHDTTASFADRALADAAVRQATESLLDKPFAKGNERFRRWATTGNGYSVIGWLSLRIKKADLTFVQAKQLLMDTPTAWRSIYTAWGFPIEPVRGKKKVAPETSASTAVGFSTPSSPKDGTTTESST
jgi:hypothetical protein